MAKRPHFKFEDAYEGIVCGIDEVGRGPLAGPVVAAAVVIDRARAPKKLLALIHDSKQVSAKNRAYIYNELPAYAHISIEECNIDEIDTLNIFHASQLAMKKAFEKLCTILSSAPVTALIDGNKAPKLSCETKTIVKGDTISLSIAAASIMAKHYRDQLMAKHALEFPQYGWEKNAGYGTPHHLKALEIHGVTYLHRRSFAPVSKQMVKVNSANS